MRTKIVPTALLAVVIALCATMVTADDCGYSYTVYPEKSDARIELAMLMSEPNWIAKPDLVRKAGILHHNMALDGSAVNIKDCLELLGGHLRAHPDDAEALAYYNSCAVLKTKDEQNLGEQLAQINSAAQSIDRCVEACPENVNIRLVRIRITKDLLSLRGKKDLISLDYKQIIVLAAEHPELEGLAAEARAWLRQNQEF